MWREQATLLFALAIIPICALVGLERAFRMLNHLHIWAAYGNFFGFLAAGLAAAFVVAGRD